MPDERPLDTFLDLVRIDSPSREEAAVAEYCRARLDCARVRSLLRRHDCSNRLGHRQPDRASLRPRQRATLVLSAHMDCVEPCRGVEPVVEDGVVRSAGETVLGADDKVGIAAIIEAARRLLAEEGPLPDLRVVLTVSEETGLTGAKALEPGSAEGDLCLVLDAEGRPGGIVIAAPTHYTFGRPSTGRPLTQASSPRRASRRSPWRARAIAAMELGRLDDETTANVGTIEGGTATNVIAPEAELTGECRSLDAERVEEVRKSMHAVMREAAESAGGHVEIEWTEEYRGFRFR